MKIFVTVGNTYFNNLIQAIDERISPDNFDVTIQLAEGQYTPKNHEYFKFTDHVNDYIDQADVVITHAGAGSVFKLLEKQKKLVVVPNNVRIDSHQFDLAKYVDDENLASVCYDLTQIESALSAAVNNQYSPYKNNPFSGYDSIWNLMYPSKDKNLVGGLPLNIFSSIDNCLQSILPDDGKVIPGSAIAINPEKIIRSMQSSDIYDTLMCASIRYADGIGVVKTLTRKSKSKVSRIPGCELWEALMKKSGKLHTPVFLVGASADVIMQTKLKLETEYSVNVCGFQDGYFDQTKEQEVIDQIVKAKPLVVSVALGSPRQEIFIGKCRKVCPDTFFMGVGGTYDVYTKNVKRAPEFFIKLNLEWFYRLMSQPSRLFRQTNLLKYLYLELTRQL